MRGDDSHGLGYQRYHIENCKHAHDMQFVRKYPTRQVR